MQFEDMRDWWNAVALGDAKTAILSGQQGWDEDQFFRSGVDWLNRCRDIAYLCLGKFGPVELSGRSALDFGCGIGRMTRALSASYEHVLGVDISEEMIHQARLLNKNPSVHFRIVERYPLELPERSFDLVFSTIAIQHIPPPHNGAYLRALLRLVADDGIGLFDMPSSEELEEFRGHGVFFLPFEDVMQVARDEGLKLIGLSCLNWNNGHYQYVFQR